MTGQRSSTRTSSWPRRLRIKFKDGLITLRSSVTLKVFLMCLVVYFVFSVVYAHYEQISVFKALFFVFLGLLSEYGASPETPHGYIAILVVMAAGILLLAVLISEVSSYFVNALLSQNRFKIKTRFWDRGHILICGTNSKLSGILDELRSEDLDKRSWRTVVVLAPDVAEYTVSSSRLKKRVIGIEGDPLRFEDLKRAGLERVSSVVLLSNEEKQTKKRLYGDTNTILIYNTIFNYLKNTNTELVRDSIHIVIEFLEDDINLLPFGGACVDQPEVYSVQVPGKPTRLIIEPVYLEKMPNYLFVQSLFCIELNEIVQRLLSTQFSDSNEFYYLPVPERAVGRPFFTVEEAALETNCTAVGVLRNDNGKMRFILNPTNADAARLHTDDQIVISSYNEQGMDEVGTVLQRVLDEGPMADRAPDHVEPAKKKRPMPFSKLVICNWHRDQIKDILKELVKIVGCFDHNSFEVLILSSIAEGRLERGIAAITRTIERELDQPVPFTVEGRQLVDPFRLRSLIESGITADAKNDLRIMVLSEEATGDENPDRKTLYQALLIENKISQEIVTAVEVFESRNYEYFKNTSIDVVVSINDFSEKLIAQAILKPYITLIFRNLLSFSARSNEFYLRPIPARFLNRPLYTFIAALIGYPVIFLAHGRPNADGEYDITINPKLDGEAYDTSFITYPRVNRGDEVQAGDVAFLVSYTPALVDAVLEQIGNGGEQAKAP